MAQVRTERQLHFRKTGRVNFLWRRGQMTEQPRWLASPWPLGLMICGAAVTWLLLWGDPLESLERRWLGQILRWRNELGAAPPTDPRIVHVDVGHEDLVKL